LRCGLNFLRFLFFFFSSCIRKFLVGYEMLADLCRDIPAEMSAQMLRDMSEVHYKKRGSS